MSGPTFVGGAYATSGSPISYSPTAGNNVVVAIFNTVTSGTLTAALTDSESNLYSNPLNEAGPYSGLNYFVSLFYLPNVPAGITSFTPSFSGGVVGNIYVFVAEYSDTHPWTFLGVPTPAGNGQNAPGTGANAITSNTINITSVAAVLIGFVLNPSNHPVSAGTSPLAFTLDFGTAGDGISVEHAAVLSSGNAAATATTVNAANDFITTAIAFADGAAPVPYPPLNNGGMNVQVCQ